MFCKGFAKVVSFHIFCNGLVVQIVLISDVLHWFGLRYFAILQWFGLATICYLPVENCWDVLQISKYPPRKTGFVTKYPPAAIILGWGPKAAEARGVVRFLPQDDRLLRHVEVVLAQFILGNHHHDDHPHSNCSRSLPA